MLPPYKNFKKFSNFKKPIFCSKSISQLENNIKIQTKSVLEFKCGKYRKKREFQVIKLVWAGVV